MTEVNDGVRVEGFQKEKAVKRIPVKNMIASYSLNHPTQPDIRVMVIQDAPKSFHLEEYREGVHVRDHYFPEIHSAHAMQHEARMIVREARR